MILDNLDQEAKKGSVMYFLFKWKRFFQILRSRAREPGYFSLPSLAFSPYRSKSELCATMDPRDYDHDHNLILAGLRVGVGGRWC